MRRLATIIVSGSATLCLMGVLAVWEGCRKAESGGQMPILDVLRPDQKKPVGFRKGCGIEALSPEHIQGIATALGRTPGVAYDVIAIAVFPTNGFPMAAKVQVEGFFLFLCLAEDDQWHVYRKARYQY